MQLDLLRCPDCHGTLSSKDDQTLTCEDCGETYAIQNGIPRLVGSRSAINASELATQDYVTDFYENVRYKLPWARTYHEHTLQQMLALARVSGTVLDNGCGNGVFLQRLARDGQPGTRFVGADISLAMLEHAKRRLADCDAEVDLVQADACRLPFEDNVFDAVFARGLLHHLPDPKGGAGEIARVLRPGGVVLVLDPNRTIISELPRRLVRGTAHFAEDHKNFTARQLRSILTPHLRVDEVHYVGYIAYPLLGFPDITNFGKFLPLDKMAPSLMKLDDLLSHVPGVRRLSWGLVVRAIAD